jgi:hypothetical protein
VLCRNRSASASARVLKKHSTFAVGAKIEYEFVLLGMAIWPDDQNRLFHAKDPAIPSTIIFLESEYRNISSYR